MKNENQKWIYGTIGLVIGVIATIFLSNVGKLNGTSTQGNLQLSKITAPNTLTSVSPAPVKQPISISKIPVLPEPVLPDPALPKAISDAVPVMNRMCTGITYMYPVFNDLSYADTTEESIHPYITSSNCSLATNVDYNQFITVSNNICLQINNYTVVYNDFISALRNVGSKESYVKNFDCYALGSSNNNPQLYNVNFIKDKYSFVYNDPSDPNSVFAFADSLVKTLPIGNTTTQVKNDITQYFNKILSL